MENTSPQEMTDQFLAFSERNISSVSSRRLPWAVVYPYRRLTQSQEALTKSGK